eukprot:GHVN01083861.1.p1 GENE.GHVN01083861.1~~GHVN01083861.1.p1  ORF type:complete len:135 (+),score=22.26 GHVN01083861.1:262-666(+)
MVCNTSDKPETVREGDHLASIEKVQGIVQDAPPPSSLKRNDAPQKLHKGLNLDEARSHLTSSQFERLKEVITEHRNVFATGNRINTVEGAELPIETTGRPICQSPRRVSPQQREVIRKEVTDMLENGQVEHPSC